MSYLKQNLLAGAVLVGVGLAGAALVVGILAFTQFDDRDEERAPSPSDPDAYAVWLVEEALELYEAEGLEATLDHYNAPERVDGPWYVFVLEERDDGIYTIANAARPELVGTTRERIDTRGFDYGAAFAETTEAGHWVTYSFINPQTGGVELKHSWTVRRGAYLFGSGWYEATSVEPPQPAAAPAPTKAEPGAYTKAFVQQALDRYEAHGLEATLDYYNSPESVDGEWYVFVGEEREDGLYTIAHATRPELVGTTRERIDRRGFDYGAAFAATTEEGQWVDYIYLNTVTGQEEQKHTWIVRRGDLLFGSGWYELADDQPAAAPEPATKAEPGAYTRAFVQQALDRFDAEGREATLDYYRSPDSVDGDWYVFVLEDRPDGLYNIGNATRPDLLGTVPNRIDRRGIDYGVEFLATTDAGRWVDYVILNPATCEERLKHSWVVRRGDLIFGSGWYEDRVADHPLIPTKCEPAAYTVAHVNAAIARYEAGGRAAAVAWHNDSANNDGRWYTFIVDPAAERMISHPAPSFIGYDVVRGSAAWDDSGWHYASDLLRATEDGLFVHDTLVVPPTDEINPFFSREELKHYYAKRHDGLIFVSGWYSDVPTAEDEPNYTRLLVARALTMLEDEGIEAVLDYYNTPESADGERYVFVLEDREDGIYTVAHAAIPVLVGTTRDRIDARGFDYGAAFRATTRSGRWVQYVFPNPDTGGEELKHTWVVRRGDYLIGSGWYEPLPTQADPEGYTRLLVADALAFYESEGLEATLDRFNAPESVDGPWYVFVGNPDGILIGHYDPEVRDRSLLGSVGTDINGYEFGSDMVAIGQQGGWVSYVFLNPNTGLLERKHTWVIRRDGHLFGSGWYEPVE